MPCLSIGSHSFDFHRRRTRPHTWSVPTPFIIHILTLTQTMSRLPTSDSGSTDARMVWCMLLDWNIDISRLNVSRCSFSRLIVAQIDSCWNSRTVQYHTWPFGSPISQHIVVMTSFDIPHMFTSHLLWIHRCSIDW